MEIIAKCPGCKQASRLESRAVDKRIRCPRCARLFKVPDLDELNKAVEIIRNAKGPIYVDEEGEIYG